MGIQVSKTQVSGGSFFMKPGDTFLYSVEDPRGRVLNYGSTMPNASWLQNVVINPGDEGKKHMIYEGKVTELVSKGGKILYRYKFTRMWSTPDRFRNSGQGVVGPWAWSGFGESSWYQKFYFGTEEESPQMLSVPPKGGTYPANHQFQGKPTHSLAAPKEIPSDDPNLAVNGDFSRLSNQEILTFLNQYAMNASYTGRTSVPEVQERAKTYLSMSKSNLEKTYKSYEDMYINYAKDTMLTVMYKDSNGMPESEKMNTRSFLDNGILLLKDKDTIREFTGLVVDRGADYDNIFQQEKDTIREHRKEFVGENGFGEEAVMPNIELTGGNLAFPNPRTDIPFVRVKDPLDTDQIMNDTGYAKIQNVLRNNPSIEGWTQVIQMDTNGLETVSTTFYKNVSMSSRVVHEDGGFVSGLTRGHRQLDVIGSEDKKVGISSYYGVRESRAEYSDNIVKQLRGFRIEILGMLQAYIQNNHTIRGTGGVLDMMRGGSDIASRMYLLSEAVNSNINAVEKALMSREKIFKSSPMDEGFVSSSVNQKIQEDNEINRLRTAIEQNEAVADQIGNASTMTSTRFFGALLSAGAFFAISFYSLRK